MDLGTTRTASGSRITSLVQVFGWNYGGFPNLRGNRLDGAGEALALGEPGLGAPVVEPVQAVRDVVPLPAGRRSAAAPAGSSLTIQAVRIAVLGSPSARSFHILAIGASGSRSRPSPSRTGGPRRVGLGPADRGHPR